MNKNVKEFLYTLPGTVTIAYLLYGCGSATPTPPSDTCAGIYDNGQPCEQRYDPNWTPDPEPTITQDPDTGVLSTEGDK